MSSLSAPVSALPLDLFRVLVGLLGVGYFVRTLREIPDFGAPDGLIDHSLQRRLLPFTRMGLFPERSPVCLLRALYLTGCVASAMLALGVASVVVAPLLYVLAVSAYRHHFLVVGVDDAIVHLALFWMVILPVGHTLVLPDLLSRHEDVGVVWDGWRSASASGLGVRCLLINLALAYVTAGLWKLTSPLWKSGSALRVVLAMPVSCGLGPHLATWPARWLKVATWIVLLVEPLGALLLALPPRCWQAWPILALVVALHVGIVATVKVPLANLAMLATLVSFVALPALSPGAPGIGAPTIASSATAGWVALGVVACLAGQIAFDAVIAALGRRGGPPTSSGRVRNPFYAPLWIVGLAQSYRLLDWVDDRNYDVRYEAVERSPGLPDAVVDASRMFPRSMRHVLMQSYLFGDLWVGLDPDARAELRSSVLARYADRYARRRSVTANSVEVEVSAIVRRVTADDAGDAISCGAREVLMRFPIRGGSTSALACSVAYPSKR